ncbi:MAG: class I SAM-dependent methyltransferase [Bryobacteraceae bacterium]
MELIAQAAAATTPGARTLLDIGCGAGNYSIRLRQALPALEVTLVDLSRPMLDRAIERLGRADAVQGDIREVELGEARFDLVVATAVLHHLRGDDEWRSVFARIFRCLRPGGSLWVADLVEHTTAPVQDLMWRRYGDYLCSLKGEAYRDHVFEYVTYEDSPRPLLFQLDRLREAGFAAVEVLHKNSCFAAFGAIKSC